MLKKGFFALFMLWFCLPSFSQITDTIPVKIDTSLIHIPTPVILDTPLRIQNLNPFITLHVDSSLSYQLNINKDEKKYYWYLKNSPVGLRINKDNGLLSFKAEKTYFLSGKLRYDVEYIVNLGVQNLANPTERVDTSFTLIFFNTEIVQPKIKLTVGNSLLIDEGQKVSFQVLCEAGNFPIENILFSSSVPIGNFKLVKRCDDMFEWDIPYDFVTESDEGKKRDVTLTFIGSTRQHVRDTANIKITVKDALNYPRAVQEHRAVDSAINDYITKLQYLFFKLDKQVRKTKGTRTGFDVTAGTAALTGTIFNTSTDKGMQNTGKVLPSVGVALTPIKEATSPNKTVEQNQATLIRSATKRLVYMLNDNMVIGDKDPDIAKKIATLKSEYKQTQAQLSDVPIEMVREMTKEDLDKYFNSRKVNKKYRLK